VASVGVWGTERGQVGRRRGRGASGGVADNAAGTPQKYVQIATNADKCQGTSDDNRETYGPYHTRATYVSFFRSWRHRRRPGS